MPTSPRCATRSKVSMKTVKRRVSWPVERAANAKCLEEQGPASGLLRRFDVGTGLLDAALGQLGLYFRFLSSEQIYFRFKGLITRQFHLDAVFSGSDQQRMSRATQFTGVSDVIVIEKYRRPSWLNRDLQSGGYLRSPRPRHQVQNNSHGQCLPRFDHDFLRKVIESRLAYHDPMFTWQQKHFLVSLQLLQVSDVSAIDPNPRILLQLCGSLKPHFSHHLVVPCSCTLRREEKTKTQKQELGQSGLPRFGHSWCGLSMG